MASAGSEAGAPGDARGAGGEDGVFGDGSQASAGAGGEDEFDRSLEDFDAILGAEQVVLARTGTGTAADQVLSEAARVGGPSGTSEQGTSGSGAQDEEGTSGGIESSVQGSERETGPRAPDFVGDEPALAVEGCNDEDTVARQLCELATQEEDPVFREQLWEEYNEYLKIVARQ